MREFVAFVVLLVLGIAFVLVSRSVRRGRFRAGMRARFGEMFYIAPGTGDYIGIDYKTRQVVLGTQGGRASAAYEFARLLAVDVLENNLTHVRMVRPADGAGVAAAVITPERVPPPFDPHEPHQRVLALQVTVDDAANSVHLVRFSYGFVQDKTTPWTDDQEPAFVALRAFYDHLRRAMQDSVSSRAVRLAENPLDDPGACTVTLNSTPNPQKAAEVLRRLRPDLDLEAALGMVMSLPAEVLTNVSRETADAMARELEREGLGVSIRQRGRRRW